MSQAAVDLLADAEAAFVAEWPAAQRVFSPHTRLLPPIYCHTAADEQQAGLQGSFAMIRMRDDRIVIGLGQVVERRLLPHAYAILCHEVGHYVHAPGTLLEHVRLHDRIKRSLPTAVRSYAGVVANLYTDLLLNDRLQRSCGVDIASVYVALRNEDAGPLWTVYVRMYERLWRLPTGTLGPAPTPEIDADAELGARIVRVFRNRWMDGAVSFSKLIAPYFEQLDQGGPVLPSWLDTAATTVGDRIPEGLLEDDFDPDDTPHPALDERVVGGGEQGESEGEPRPGDGTEGRSLKGDGRPDARRVRRGPGEYLDLLRSMGVTRSPKEVVASYYRELALPHVVPFPAQRIERAGDPLPEGLDAWEAGQPLSDIDWLETLLRSPVVVPGVTTVQRTYGLTEGGEPERRPPDLYLGIDCSGSMGNPAHQLAYPVVAGVVLALSALRAGARVMACLSGEWHGKGEHLQTPGFLRSEDRILGVLTDYLGTGCSFGLPRLVETFAAPMARPTHIVVVSDSDLFSEIDGTTDGWALAKRAIDHAGGGATAVLRLAGVEHYAPWLERMREVGFVPHCVTSEEQLVDFARAFSRRTFSFDR